MDDDRYHDDGWVLVTSTHRRVRTGIRALLEAAGIPVLEMPAPDAADAASRSIAVVVLDLTEDTAIPPTLIRPDAPPVIGVVEGLIAATPAPHLAAAVQIDDGPDAILDAVRRALSRPRR